MLWQSLSLIRIDREYLRPPYNYLLPKVGHYGYVIDGNYETARALSLTSILNLQCIGGKQLSRTLLVYRYFLTVPFHQIFAKEF